MLQTIWIPSRPKAKFTVLQPPALLRYTPRPTWNAWENWALLRASDGTRPTSVASVGTFAFYLPPENLVLVPHPPHYLCTFTLEALASLATGVLHAYKSRALSLVGIEEEVGEELNAKVLFTAFVVPALLSLEAKAFNWSITTTE